MKKAELRRYYLNIRMNLSEVELLDRSRRIAEHLFGWKLYREAATLHTYASSRTKNEIDTFPIIQRALEEGKRVIVPKMVEPAGLLHCQITSTTALRPNRWDIPEPDCEVESPVNELDLILVPMAATDLYLNRIGYGKGYYDRFLREAEAVKVGLILDSLVHDQKLPTEEHDIPMDFVISESGIRERI